MKNINTVELGSFVTDGNGNFAHVKEDENGKEYYANYFPQDDDDIDSAVFVSDMDEEHI